MGDPEKVVDQPVKEWVARSRVLLQQAREKPRAVADDSGLDRTRRPADQPLSAQGRQMDLAKADADVAQRVKREAEIMRRQKADALRKRLETIGNPDEASADELKPLDEARQAAKRALDTVPLGDAELRTAEQQLLRMQDAAKSAAAAVLKRLRARVADVAKPLADPSLAAPADAEGAEWKPLQDAVALATRTKQALLERETLRSDEVDGLKKHVDTAIEARDLALRAIQQRLRQAADQLLTKVDPPGLQRVPDSNDGEWKPVADLITAVHAALDKPVLKGDDLRAAEARLQNLKALLGDARTAVRDRLALEADAARIMVNRVVADIAKQRKSKLGGADAFELQIVKSQVERLEALTQLNTMTGTQIAQARQGADGVPTLLANVLAMVKAREALAATRRDLHGDVRKIVNDGCAALPEVMSHDKLRAEVPAEASVDRAAALTKAGQDAVKAVQAAELAAMKLELKRLTKEAADDINATLMECASSISTSSKDSGRKAYAASLVSDGELGTLKTELKDLSDRLAAASAYDAAVASVPGLVADAKCRARQILVELRLSTALGTTPSASGKSVDERMKLLRDVRGDLAALERRVLAVRAAGLTLPSTERVLAEIEKLSDAIDIAQAATLEDDCAAWRKKLTSLGGSHDSDITALRSARATTQAGADHLKDRAKLYRSGGTAPSRGDVEAAIGAAADPGHTLGAWAYTWDALLAEIRNALKDGRLTQQQLDKLSGGGGQRYVNLGNHHISVTFRSEGSLYCVYELHVSLESAAEIGRPRYWFSVTDGTIAAKPSTQAKPNPSGDNIPPGYAAAALGLINANKTKYNCK